MCFSPPNNIIFLFFSSDFCYIVYYLLVLAKFMIFIFSLHKVFKGADIYREVGLTWERCSN